MLALFSWLPLVTYKLLDAALAIVYIPFGVSIAHMLIHEEHYDHMRIDGLFRFYRNPKIMLRCIILVVCTKGIVVTSLFLIEELLLHFVHHELLHTLIEICIFIFEEALIAYFFLTQYLFIMHEGHSLRDVVRTSYHAMKGDIFHHLCFDFSLFIWYLIPIALWMIVCGFISLMQTGEFLLPALSLRELSGNLFSVLYTIIITVFYFFYTPYTALCKILFAEHAWEEAQKEGKVHSTKQLPKQRKVASI